jgi:DNA polymerase-4
MRKIIHIDMDAFYASVEQRDFPDLRDKAIAVGGSSKRGVVMTASYEARKFGVRSAMPSSTAYRLCPQLIFVKPRFDVYKKVSSQIRAIFLSYTDLVEPLSLDEAYLDVTENKPAIESAAKIARDIKQSILLETHLTASAGVSINKFLAKIASDYHKPDGLSVIMPHQVQGFIDSLEIDKFHGIGKVTAGKMHQMGIHTGADLKKFGELELVKLFGKNGRYYHRISRGIDNRPVNPDRIRKSISSENTFEADITDPVLVRTEVLNIAKQVMNWMERHKTYGRTVTLKVKFNDFKQITRSKTNGSLINNLEELEKIADELQASLNDPRPIRLLGLGVSNLNIQEPGDSKSQLTLDL